MNGQYDVVAFGAHPDDIELSCGGTVAKLVSEGTRVAIVDLTRGELGTRGSAELRDREASAAAEILGVAHRTNLGLADGFFVADKPSLLKVVSIIRRFRPRIVIANALTDRHPDHGRGADLVAQACFLSGLPKVEVPGENDAPHRPEVVYHYIQDYDRTPDLVVDITGFSEVKMKSILAYSSQFYDPESTEPNTPISSPEFLDHIKGRELKMGRPCGFEAGEGFEILRPVGANSLLDLK